MSHPTRATAEWSELAIDLDAFAFFRDRVVAIHVRDGKLGSIDFGLSGDVPDKFDIEPLQGRRVDCRSKPCAHAFPGRRTVSYNRLLVGFEDVFGSVDRFNSPIQLLQFGRQNIEFHLHWNPARERLPVNHDGEWSNHSWRSQLGEGGRYGRLRLANVLGHVVVRTPSVFYEQSDDFLRLVPLRGYAVTRLETWFL